jgi:methyl-accepting chemotaxis protein
MVDKYTSMAEAIIQASHIISNNGAGSPSGTQYGGLEAHSMRVSQSIDYLAEAVQSVADQMARIADSIEEQKNA